jgi:tight adherence protein C
MENINALPGLAALFSAITVFFILYAVLAPRIERARTNSAGPIDEKDTLGKYVKPVLNEFLPQLPPIKLKKDRAAKLAELIHKSGNPWRLNQEELIGIMAALAITGGIFGSIIAAFGSLDVNPLVMIIAFTAAGFFYPYSVYNTARQKRTAELQRNLPQALDLLTVTMSAGETFQPAVISVVKQLPDSLVKREFNKIAVNTQAGISIEQSLLDFASITDSDEATNFAKAVIQSQKLGSDVSETLSQQASFTRDSKETRIEEKIAKLNTTLFIPLSLTMLPAFLLIFITPIMLGLIGG